MKKLLYIFIVFIYALSATNSAACWFEPTPPDIEESGGWDYYENPETGCKSWSEYKTTTETKTETKEYPGWIRTTTTTITARWWRMRSLQCPGEDIQTDFPLTWIFLDSVTKTTTTYTDLETGEETITDDEVIIPPGPDAPSPGIPVPPGTDIPTDPGDPPIVIIPPDGSDDPPVVILPPEEPGDPPVVVPVPPGTDIPTDPGDPPVVIIPPDGSDDPPVVILPPEDPGDPPVVVPLPSENEETVTIDPENEDFTITVETYEVETTSINEAQVKTTVITLIVITTRTNNVTGEFTREITSSVKSFWRECLICGKEGDWDLPICPDTNLTCPDCGENIHGVIDHECPGVPENPTEADPGKDPDEDGEPDNEPPPPVHDPAKFYFSRINQQKISKPVGTTYTVDIPMSVYLESTTGANPGNQTIYLHCIPDVVTSGANYDPAVTSAELKGFTPPAPELMIFGRSLYPNLQNKKGNGSWHSDDEFMLIITTSEDSGEALNEAENHCNKEGCKYHLRVKFRQQVKPGR